MPNGRETTFTYNGLVYIKRTSTGTGQHPNPSYAAVPYSESIYVEASIFEEYDIDNPLEMFYWDASRLGYVLACFKATRKSDGTFAYLYVYKTSTTTVKVGTFCGFDL